MKQLPARGALVLVGGIGREASTHVVELSLPLVDELGGEPVKLVVIDEVNVEPTGFLQIRPLVIEDGLLELSRLDIEQSQLLHEGPAVVLEESGLEVDVVNLDQR